MKPGGDNTSRCIQYWIDAYKRPGLPNVLKNQCRITGMQPFKIQEARLYNAIRCHFFRRGLSTSPSMASGKSLVVSKTSLRRWSDYWTS